VSFAAHQSRDFVGELEPVVLSCGFRW